MRSVVLSPSRFAQLRPPFRESGVWTLGAKRFLFWFSQRTQCGSTKATKNSPASGLSTTNSPYSPQPFSIAVVIRTGALGVVSQQKTAEDTRPPAAEN